MAPRPTIEEDEAFRESRLQPFAEVRTPDTRNTGVQDVLEEHSVDDDDAVPGGFGVGAELARFRERPAAVVSLAARSGTRRRPALSTSVSSGTQGKIVAEP